MPLAATYLKARHLSLIDKCKSRLEEWSSQSLSFAGNFELTTSIIQDMISYRVQSFLLPVSICNQLEKLYANFL